MNEGRAIWQAIDRLAIAQYPTAGDAMMRAEKDQTNSRIQIDGKPTVQDLGGRLGDVWKGNG